MRGGCKKHPSRAQPEDPGEEDRGDLLEVRVEEGRQVEAVPPEGHLEDPKKAQEAPEALGAREAQAAEGQAVEGHLEHPKKTQETQEALEGGARWRRIGGG